MTIRNSNDERNSNSKENHDDDNTITRSSVSGNSYDNLEKGLYGIDIDNEQNDEKVNAHVSGSTSTSVGDRGRRLRERANAGSTTTTTAGDGDEFEEQLDRSYVIRAGCNFVGLVLIAITFARPDIGGIQERRTYYSGYFFGIIFTLALLVNAPWYCRKNGTRISIVQILCNLVALAGLLYVIFGSDSDFSVGLVAFFYATLFALVNIPSFLPDGGALRD